MSMRDIKKISGQHWGSTVFVIGCSVAGALLGRYMLFDSLGQMHLANAKKQALPDAPFIVPAAPPETMKNEQDLSQEDGSKSTIGLSELRVWEVAVKQPLPPRKEPLTPPRWRIVGVTSVGSEKSVLLLFENQPATETRKIGEKLPGGAKIVEIAQDQLKISLNGQLMKLNLRKQ
ncbi:hypothetical protein AAKU64_003366 [Undibacterium sp. GrIS 1.8]|uniref:hypothetical protein n=1 Tax=Undibacterium sp. GrIS 1.8 TaxID=3143934 RepID=UPI003392857C